MSMLYCEKFESVYVVLEGLNKKRGERVRRPTGQGS